MDVLLVGLPYLTSVPTRVASSPRVFHSVGSLDFGIQASDAHPDVERPKSHVPLPFI